MRIEFKLDPIRCGGNSSGVLRTGTGRSAVAPVAEEAVKRPSGVLVRCGGTSWLTRVSHLGYPWEHSFSCPDVRQAKAKTRIPARQDRSLRVHSAYHSTDTPGDVPAPSTSGHCRLETPSTLTARAAKCCCIRRKALQRIVRIGCPR